MRSSAARSAIAALVTLALVALFGWQSADPHAADFKSFYSAGYAVTHPGVPLYDVPAIQTDPFGEVFKLPPPAAVLLAPLGVLELRTARLVWRVALGIAYFGAALMLCRTFGVRPLSLGWVATVAAWSVFAPAQVAIGEGQWDPLLLLALTMAACALASGHGALAALAIGAAGAVKLYPLAVAAIFLARWQWRNAVLVMVTALGLVALSVTIVGVDALRDYTTGVLPATGAITPYVDNQAIGGVLARLLMDDVRPIALREWGGLDASVKLLAVAAIGAATLLVAWRRPTDALGAATGLSLFVPLCITFIPAGWTHYHTLLLLPCFLLTLHARRHVPAVSLQALLLALCFLVSAAPGPAVLIGEDVDRALWQRSRSASANAAVLSQFPGPAWRLLLSYKTGSALLLTALVAWRIAQTAPRASADERRSTTAIAPPASPLRVSG
ncbi:MAG: glycosyltransferase family 87 protein [Chloroflexota bacterium]